jgi:6-phosphogluconolactonase
MSEHHFASCAALAQALAQAVADALRHGVEQRGAASLAVSGGRTPLAFFEALSHQKLDWSKVSITLADERWVPQSDARSNTKLVYQHLLVNEALPARFVPLVNHATTPEAGLKQSLAALHALPLPLDVVVLGMGDDGHTASWFPGGDHLAQALDAQAPPLVTMRAEGAPEPRITFTAPVLLHAAHLFLHFEGASKRAVYEKARTDGAVSDMPVRAALRAERQVPMQLYWCG